MSEETCAHPGFMKRNCMVCGQEADSNDPIVQSTYDSSIPFRYLCEDLRLGKKEIARLKDKNTKDMLSQRKLHLVLDLDHTLLHSTSLPLSGKDDRYKSIWKKHSKLPGILKDEICYVRWLNMLIKIRPYAEKFLKEASTMFDMHIYTLGARGYAKEMARLLDPHGIYFGSNIVSREDCTCDYIKSLDIILGKENATLILDDTTKVWPDHKANLIRMKKYVFWALNCGETENDRTLVSALDVLKKVHEKFFQESYQRKNPKKKMQEKFCKKSRDTQLENKDFREGIS